MAYGITIYNADGDVQVDGINPNLAVIASGTSSSTITTIYEISISHTAVSVPPVVAVRCNTTGNYVGYVKHTKSGADYVGIKFTVLGIGSYDYLIAVPFDVLANPTTADYGLYVVNGSDKAVFSSDYKNVLIRDVVAVNVPAWTSTDVTFNHVAVSNPHFVLHPIVGSLAWGNAAAPPGYSGIFVLMAANVSSTSSKVKIIPIGYIPTLVYDWYVPVNFDMLVVELSN